MSSINSRCLTNFEPLNFDDICNLAFAPMSEILRCWVNLLLLIMSRYFRSALCQDLLNLALRLDEGLQRINGNGPLLIMGQLWRAVVLDDLIDHTIDAIICLI